MHLTCPCCNARFPVEAAIQDEAARACVAAALKLPVPVGDLLLRYLGLFRPAKRALAWNRVRTLLAELAESMAEATVSRNGIERAAPLELWRMGIEETLHARDTGTLDLPLKGHGYLFKVVWSKSGQLAGAAEKKREEQLRGRPSDRTKGARHIATLLDGLKNAAEGRGPDRQEPKEDRS